MMFAINIFKSNLFVLHTLSMEQLVQISIWLIEKNVKSTSFDDNQIQ